MTIMNSLRKNVMNTGVPANLATKLPRCSGDTNLMFNLRTCFGSIDLIVVVDTGTTVACIQIVASTFNI